MIVPMIFALAALQPGAGPSPAGCSLSRPAMCRDTNQLVWSPGFEPALRRFAGTVRGSYISPGATLADQLRLALGGPPEEPRRLADGSRLFAACRAHSCMEKGAIVVDARGEIVAAGLLNFRCGRRNRCGDGWVLDIFVPQQAARSSAPADAIRAWAREMEAQAPATGLGRYRIERTEVHVLPGSGAARPARAGRRPRR